MNQISTGARTLVVEREYPYSSEKIWRALTQPHLLGEWLMKNDFEPATGHRFNFRSDWGDVDCEVLAIEPHRALSYTWSYANENPDYALEAVVTFTLTPTGDGTRLRMEQRGHRPDQTEAYEGAQFGWEQHFAKLEQVLARIG